MSAIHKVNFRSILFSILCLSFSSCALMRGVFLGFPDHKDIHRFPSSEITVGDACFEFKADANAVVRNLRVTDWSSGSPYFVTLDQLNTSRPVRSMLIIRNDTLLYDFYGQQTTADDVNPSYSVAKSFTSAMIGIAIQEGKIKSVHDKVIDYIPELKDIPMSEKLEVEHLLNMTSGFKLKLITDAELYYGNDVVKALKKVEFEHEPGTYQEYINLDVQILGLILHRATGMKPSEYVSEKIWKPINMCSDAIWTTDKKGEDKTFCCMGATALDYAKFGRLYLNNGNWNGTQIVPKDWVEKSVSRDTTNGSGFGYNYNWHIGEKAYGDYMADGMYKQHIYVQPEKKIVIVLMCNSDNALAAERVRWRHVFRQIVDQL
ncbi:MAG: beta-lactamase family protein [Flavobacteriales bacterium]|nr:beta-lactamase family protein [Flavobacteriales bacterium]